MTEYGIFTDEGCIEAGFWSRDEAELATVGRDDFDADDVEIHAICSEHEEQPADYCEECASEDSDEDEDED